MAYEFEMRWNLWAPEIDTGYPNPTVDSDSDIDPEYESAALDPLWKLQPATVRILGFGPKFDDASFDQNGHIRIDFGLDTPWLAETLEDEQLDEAATKHIQQNVEMLLAFTLSVEKNCGISSPPPLDRIRRTPRPKTHRPPPTRQLVNPSLKALPFTPSKKSSS